MKNHECLVGKHDYQPGHGFKLLRKIRKLELKALISNTAWFDSSRNGPLGTDGKDYNKLAGVSFVRLFSPGSWAKNRNSVLVAWRPSTREDYFEVAAYTNDKRGGFNFSEPVLVKADSYFFCEVVIMDGVAKYLFKVNGVRHERSAIGFDRRGRAVPVGPWFGGNRTSPTKHVIVTDFRMKR